SGPSQLEDLAAPQRSVEGANQNCPQVFTAPFARIEKTTLFVEGQDAIPPALVRLADQSLGALERRANDPAFALGVGVDRAQQFKLAVDRGDRELAASD